MKKRLLYGTGAVLLAILVTLVIWQGSFTFGNWGPAGPEQTFLFWAVSTLIFLLTVTLGFMLFRAVLKLYIERQRGNEGSRIRTKLVAGALALTFTPVMFLVLWSIQILNRNLDKWFTRPAESIKSDLVQVSRAFKAETQARAQAQAAWLAGLPETRAYIESGNRDSSLFERYCRDNGIDYAVIHKADGAPLPICGSAVHPAEQVAVSVNTAAGGGTLTLRTHMRADLAEKQKQIDRNISEYDQLAVSRREIRRSYLLLLVLITLFILFVATWIAQFLARQISEPIAALLHAAKEVRSGNLSYRLQTKAIDELATLVRGFNEMTQALETNREELERRRRFTETILESIPTGVLSLASDGRILKVNSALSRIFPSDLVSRAARIDDLFSKEDTGDIRYLMKRARRTGLAASRQFELKQNGQTLSLSATVSALEERATSGFVLVIEDASEMLRAQKATAWHEVARRIAHEIKNPLTPISLCAERIARQMDRATIPADTERILRECAGAISREVESVKTLVDEFSQFARFPAAQLAPCDLNDIVENALGVFTGRLDGIELHKDLAPNLPLVYADREHLKRVVINLVDNAAEAMQESLVKRLWVATGASTPETVELVVADTGCGISTEDKEKLFLPYFSTKGRGTGLGLAIVAHILSEHDADVRVEDNLPVGARFVVDIPALVQDGDVRTAESRA